MVTTFGMCPGIKSGESRIDALERQINFYGRYRAHRFFFDNGLMDPNEDEYEILTEDMIASNEDVWVSCKNPETTSIFRDKVAELRDVRVHSTGKTLFTLKHEPEGDLTIAQYNEAWDIVAPVLEENAYWLLAGPILTGFRSRKVDSNGQRLNDWRDWIPSTPSTRAILQFVGADLYPGAGRPTKAKPNYYEPPEAHPSPYGSWTEIGFCGILDEMCEELGLPGAIGEFNHERPSTTNGWPSSFTDPQGDGNVAFINELVQHAKAEKYLMVCQFHKGGGILTDRSPQAEANFYAQILEDNWNDVDPEPNPEDPQYQFGFEAGWNSRQEEVNASKALGRSEAFGEVAAWAAQQS